MSCYTLYEIIAYSTVLCYVMLCHVMSCSVMLCGIALYHILSCIMCLYIYIYINIFVYIHNTQLYTCWCACVLDILMTSLLAHRRPSETTGDPAAPAFAFPALGSSAGPQGWHRSANPPQHPHHDGPGLKTPGDACEEFFRHVFWNVHLVSG